MTPFQTFKPLWGTMLLLAVSLGSTRTAAQTQIVPFAQLAPMLIARNDAVTATVHQLQHSSRRWIEINLSRQRLTAWEGRNPAYTILISTGKAATPTQPGVFAIQTRERYAHMKGAGYDVNDVPYTMYYSGSYAIHGAYWHRRFGTPISHGCINLAVNHARWLFNWARIGTPVIVRR